MAAAAPRLAAPIGASAALHAVAAATLFLATARDTVTQPPIYKVDLVAAPPGRRQIGVISPTPLPPAPPLRTQPPPAAHAVPTRTPAPVAKVPARAAPLKATPAPPSTKAPPKTPEPQRAAGGGPTGGPGADVGTIHITGTEFPFPGYLENIVRQVQLNFQPSDASQLRAEVAFLIRRDGSVLGFRFITRSGDYAFDQEAQGAIEGAAKSFGPLPEGFHDDVLPVVFSFDPRLLH